MHANPETTPQAPVHYTLIQLETGGPSIAIEETKPIPDGYIVIGCGFSLDQLNAKLTGEDDLFP